MLFYKYVRPKWVSILETGMIRFSQPAALNDPFESVPSFSAAATPAGLARVLAAFVRDHTDEQWAAGAVAFATEDDRETFAKRLEADPDLVRQVSDLIGRDLIATGRTDLYKSVNNAIGILSLSEDPMNLLMWAHYTDNHFGFVLGLDCSHEFFRANPEPDGDPTGLHKVLYPSERPPTTLETLSIKELFLTKGPDWKYEKEWRSIRWLKEADEVDLDVRPVAAHLFRMPFECIRQVIVGCRGESLLPFLRGRLTSPELRHVELLRAGLQPRKFALEFRRDQDVTGGS